MRKHRLGGILTALLVLSAGISFADTTTVNFDSGSHLLYGNTTPQVALTAGVAGTAGDGAVLQLGYFSAATTANNFAGTFIPLSGQGSTNTYTTTSIGDSPANTGGANGTFGMALSFVPGTATGNNLPAAGVPLAICFYNGTTLGNSTYYNAVSYDTWLWVAPSPTASQVSFSLDDNNGNLEWLGGPSSAFYTSQPTVPEPWFYGLAGGGLSLVALWRKHRGLTRHQAPGGNSIAT